MNSKVTVAQNIDATENNSRTLTLLITIVAGMSIANVYYNQPILSSLMKSFNATPQQISFIPFLAQLGYALGIMFISPLGDRYERKSLILTTLSALVLALALTALSSSLIWLALSSLFVGLTASATQQLVPMAVMMSSPSERGRVIGTVTSGILLGVLLARCISGFVAEQWSWQLMFWSAAIMMLISTAILSFRLPKIQRSTQLPYYQLMSSIFTLIQQHPTLRKAAFMQALIFSAFMAFWCNLSLMLGDVYPDLGSTNVGLFGLVGIAGVLCAPLAGRLADARGTVAMIKIGVLLTVTGYLMFWVGQATIVSLIIGIIFLDVGIQLSQVSNQSRVYSLDPAARSRLNTVFMTSMFIGGAVGTVVSGQLYSMLGWSGVCLFGIVVLTLALGLSLKKDS